MAATPNTYQDELNKESLNPFSSAQITQMAPPELWIPAEREPPISKDADLNAWLLNQAAHYEIAVLISTGKGSLRS